MNADDYAGLVTIDDRRLLRDGSLALLERCLPPNFIRAHHSHIINIAQASAIVREAAGGAIVFRQPRAMTADKRSRGVEACAD